MMDRVRVQDAWNALRTFVDVPESARYTLPRWEDLQPEVRFLVRLLCDEVACGKVHVFGADASAEVNA